MLRAIFSIVVLAGLVGLLHAENQPKDLEELSRKYDLELVTRSPRFPVKLNSGVIDGAEPPGVELESYLKIFIPEWSLYPTDLVHRTRLKKVVFCRNLSFEKQLRTGIPDFENDVLYLDVARGRHSDLYVRKVIHHEFFHIIDLRDDGKLYEDDRWCRLNPATFKYGQGGAKLQNDATVTTTGRDVPGFLNRYAAAGVEEDKAEVFAHLMVEPKQVAARAETDSYLRAKVERMKELLLDFSPSLNAVFWKRVEESARADGKK